MRRPQRLLASALLICFVAFLLACGEDAGANLTTATAPQDVPSSDRSATAEDAPQRRVPPQPTLTLRKTRDFHGTVFDLQGCTQTVRSIRCEFILTNTRVDRAYRINLHYYDNVYTQIFDQRGHEFAVTRLRLADIDTNGRYAEKYLITETPTRMTLFFEGVPSAIEFIKVLNIGTTDGTVQFRDIQFSPANETLGSTT